MVALEIAGLSHLSGSHAQNLGGEYTYYLHTMYIYIYIYIIIYIICIYAFCIEIQTGMSRSSIFEWPPHIGKSKARCYLHKCNAQTSPIWGIKCQFPAFRFQAPSTQVAAYWTRTRREPSFSKCTVTSIAGLLNRNIKQPYKLRNISGERTNGLYKAGEKQQETNSKPVAEEVETSSPEAATAIAKRANRS